MNKQVGLYYSPIKENVGCRKVYQNLIIGLQEMGVEVFHNKPAFLSGCLHGNHMALRQKILPPNCLIGPEIMVLPTEDPWIFKQWKYSTQPSEWVVNYMITFKETNSNLFYVWPVGINTNQFNETGRGNFQYDCFIYYKNVTHQTPITKLNTIKSMLDTNHLKYVVLEYGKYPEQALINATKNCKFGIYLTGTESQGLAIMETMASGVPVLVIEEKTFLYGGFTFTNENVSACPYFDDRCGMKTSMEMIVRDLPTFIKNVDEKKYNPRQYIIENHTMKMGAEKYYKILLEINGMKE